jgi:type I restriction enzyme S subunit
VEVRPGFQVTDVGVIPNDWIVSPLSELKPFVTSGSRGWAALYSDRGSLFVRITNMSRDSIYLDLEHPKFVSLPAQSTEGLRTQLQEHDVLISITADIGIVGYVDARVPIPAYINQHIALVRFEQGKTCSKFVSYFLASERPQRLFRASTDTGAKAGMSLPTVQKIEVALPPLPEQRAIAAALGDVDGLLGGLERLIAKKRDLKQAALQQLLTGETRLPGFHGKWEMKRLGEVLTICHGRNQREVESPDGQYPILATGGQIGRATEALCDKPSVLIGRKGTINKPQLMETPFWTVDTLFYSTLRHDNDAKFFYYRFCTIDWMQYNEASGVPSLNARTIENVETSTPTPKEQTAIAAVLSDMDAEIDALEQRRAKSRALKQGMMHELLTGRIRLVAASSNVVSLDFATIPKHVPSDPKSHNWQFNEAVVVAMLVKQFSSEQYPLGRKRCTKLGYLMHRHVERVVQGYLKKAAGPYNPAVKYKGPETIAQKNGYIRPHTSGKFSGFVAAGKIAEAEGYFDKWYGREVLAWIEQFRHQTNDELELLATVDMAVVDVKRVHAEANVAAVKSIILNHPEWEAKLEREIFSDANIARAIGRVTELFTE